MGVVTDQTISSKQFHAAAGVGDWRVVSTGAQAVFRATSLAHASRLVVPIVEAADRFGIRPDVDLRPEAIIVRVPPWAFGGIPVGTAEFAAAVSAAAADLELVPDPERRGRAGTPPLHTR